MFVFGTAESSELDAVTVKGDFQVVRHLQTTDDVYGLPVQLRSDDVFAINGEIVVDQDSPSSPDGQTFNMIVL